MSYITNVQGPSASSPNDPNDYQPTNKWSFGQDDLKQWVNIGGNLIGDILQGVAAFNFSKNNPNQTNQNNNGSNNNGNNGYNNQGGADWSLAIIIGFVVLVLAVLVFLIIKASK